MPFDTVGIGWSVDGGDAVITIVYHFDDADDAEEAAEAVEALYEDGTSFVTQQPMEELLVIDEVATDGANVIATLHLPPDRPQPIVAFQLLSQLDLPFIHT